jgi:hypothetical protein
MISRKQQILLKRGMREAGLNDAEYRDALEIVAGCRSSTDPAITDRGLDLALAYFEAIFWRRVDAGELPAPCRPNAVFRQRGYWGHKNRRQETSRDRFNASNLAQEVSALESSLHQLGFGPSYCAAIRSKIIQGRTDDYSLHLYKAALRRTLAANRRGGAQRMNGESTLLSRKSNVLPSF